MFEEMFSGGGGGGFPGGGGGGGGFPGGGFGGRAQQQQQPPTQELFPKGERIARLGKSKFPDSMSKHPWLVVFYTNDSQACAQAKPILEQLAERVSFFKVGAVDCGRNEREALFCADRRVEKDDVPQFALVVNGKLTFLEMEKDTIPSAKALHEFCVDNMPKDLIHNINHVSQVQDRLLGDVTKKKKIAVLLLTDKYETSTLYMTLAYQHRFDVSFGESRAKNLGLSKEFDVKKYPLLIAIVKEHGQEKWGEYELIRYGGPMKGTEISQWLDSLQKQQEKTATPNNKKEKQRRKHSEF
jgi:hypothetical protein